MKTSSSWLLAGLLLLGTPGCIYVRVKGDLHDDFLDDEDDDESGFHELDAAVEGCLADPQYDLDLNASPWHTDAKWTVRYASAGSDAHAAFRKAREAVLARIERKGGTLTEQHDDGPHVWGCSFRMDGEPGKASVQIVEKANESERPDQLVVAWEESD